VNGDSALSCPAVTSDSFSQSAKLLYRPVVFN